MKNENTEIFLQRWEDYPERGLQYNINYMRELITFRRSQEPVVIKKRTKNLYTKPEAARYLGTTKYFLERIPYEELPFIITRWGNKRATTYTKDNLDKYKKEKMNNV